MRRLLRTPKERKAGAKALKEATLETLRELKPKNLFRSKQEIKEILFGKK
ncbi:MAG: hypothetical protein KAJ49_06045 [Arcobacteraceae bacterium]|nr:hypothetical protein [Arcobacteraceae bacterium]